jgi:hypothetical protein
MTFTHLTLTALTTCLVFQLPQASPVAGTKQEPETLNTLAGSYYLGTGLVHTSLRIDPEGRFFYHFYADSPGFRREEGKAEIIDGFLVLHPGKVETNGKPEALTHPRYRPVRWGDRIYLISDEQMINFCNMVNLGVEPRRRGYGKEFIRITPTEKSRKGEEGPKLGEIQGRPRVPARWDKHLLEHPLEGKILEGFEDHRAKLDLGSDDGLREGMELLVEGGKPDAPRKFAIVKVVQVGARDCSVLSKRPWGLDKFEKGQKVLSRIPDTYLQNEMRWMSFR